MVRVSGTYKSNVTKPNKNTVFNDDVSKNVSFLKVFKLLSICLKFQAHSISLSKKKLRGVGRWGTKKPGRNRVNETVAMNLKEWTEGTS